jgi:DNA polymerase-3 subunit delta
LAQIKAHEFEQLIARGLPVQPIVLIYGPDRGMVSERAGLLAKETGLSLDDAFSVVRLDGSSLKGDAGRLHDEANAISLFGGKRLIWLRDVGNDKGIQDAVSDLAASPPADTTILIEAGDLKKGTGLRKVVEDARSGLAVPCYADDDRSMNALIDQVLSEAALRITPSARSLLREMLGGDRLASRGELEKLALYCRGQDVISEDDVMLIIGDSAALSVDDAVDAVLNGDVAALDRAIERITASKTGLFVALQACLRQFQLLATLRNAVDGGRSAANVMAEEGRRIHFKRKAAVEAALRRWPATAIDQALQHLHTAVLETRKRNALEESLTRQALLALAIRSGRLAA